jgi:hypothetical protein
MIFFFTNKENFTKIFSLIKLEKSVEKQDNTRSSIQHQDLQNPFSHLPFLNKQKLRDSQN